jgi:hypothetical protein
MTNKIILESSFDFKDLSGELVDEISMIWLFNTSEDAIHQSQENAPYETGKLKQSIWRQPGSVGTKTKKVVVGPRWVVYARRREFENFKNPDRKFYMRRTYKKIKKTASEHYEEAVQIVLKRHKLI